VRQPDPTWRRVAHHRRHALLTGLVGVAALVAVVVLPISDRDPTPVEVLMNEYAFVPSEVHAAAGQNVRVTNQGAITHSLLVVGLAKGVELQPGGVAEFRLPLASEGTYQLICDLPGHVEQGMAGTLVIDE
jgi:plastocyanin